MLRLLRIWVSCLVSLSLLNACGAPPQAVLAAGTNSFARRASVPPPPPFGFNLAQHIRQTPVLARTLGPIMLPGDPYLRIGTRSLFALESNLTGSSADAGPKAEFWLDAYAFGKPLGTENRQGSAVEINGQVRQNPSRAKVSIRFLGFEKFSGGLSGPYTIALTRDFGLEHNLYPLLFLGLGVGGDIGGEIGGTISPTFHGKENLGMHVDPHLAISAGLDSHIKLLNFIRAEAVGNVDLMSAELGSSIGFADFSELGLSIDSGGIEASRISLLDGSLSVVAAVSADPTALLPPQVDASKWRRWLGMINSISFSWSHIIWDPLPLKVIDFPGTATIRPYLTEQQLSAADCQAVVSGYRERARDIIDSIDKEIESLHAKLGTIGAASSMQVRRAEHTKSNYIGLVPQIEALCT